MRAEFTHQTADLCSSGNCPFKILRQRSPTCSLPDGLDVSSQGHRQWAGVAIAQNILRVAGWGSIKPTVASRQSSFPGLELHQAACRQTWWIYEVSLVKRRLLVQDYWPYSSTSHISSPWHCFPRSFQLELPGTLYTHIHTHSRCFIVSYRPLPPSSDNYAIHFGLYQNIQKTRG